MVVDEKTEIATDEADFKDLIIKAQGGDKEAFEGIIRRKGRGMVFSLMGTFKMDIQTAEDVAQETSIIIWRKLKQLKDPAKFNSWMNVILRNEGLKALNRANKRSEVSLNSMVTGDEVDGSNITEYDITDADEDFIPESYVSNIEMRSKVMDIIMDLPEKRREAIMMYYYSDLSITEIAQVVKQTPETISSVLAKARMNLKKKLELMGGTFAMATMSGQTNLGRLLHGVAVDKVPGDVVDTLVTAAQTTVAVAAPVAIGLKHAVAAVIGCAVVGGGVMTGGIVMNMQHSEAPPSSPPAVTSQANTVTTSTQEPAKAAEKGNIDIKFTGDEKFEYLNPVTAKLEYDSPDISSVSYRVVSKGGKEIAAGSGADASAELLALQANAAENQSLNGEYDLIFDINYNDGQKGHATRNFYIDVSNAKNGV